MTSQEPSIDTQGLELSSVTPTVHQVLNNNVVVIVDESGGERVLMGRGLGFKMRPKDLVDVGKVEKTFVLARGEKGESQRLLLQDAPYEVLAAATAGVAAAEKCMGRSLGRSITLAVIDHLQYLLERMDKGLTISTSAMPELRVVHPEESQAGVAMIQAVSQVLGRELPEDEGVFLTMHVLNATRDEPGRNSALLFSRVHQVVSTIEESLARRGSPGLDHSSMDYARFVLHIKFLIQRVLEETMLRGSHSAMYEVASNSYPESHALALEVKGMVASKWEVELTDEELLYLIVHIERLSTTTE